MSSRLDQSWIVIASYQIPRTDRSVELFSRPNGTFGFEEFRQDPEDLGAETPISYFSVHEYPTAEAALTAAKEAVEWLGTFLDRES